MPQFIGRVGIEKHLGERTACIIYTRGKIREFSGDLKKNDNGFFIRIDDKYREKYYFVGGEIIHTEVLHDIDVDGGHVMVDRPYVVLAVNSKRC